MSEEAHRKLTGTLGTLMAQASKMQTYQDAIEAMLNQSVKLTPALLAKIESLIETKKQLGFMTREEFIRHAIRWRLKFLEEETGYVEIPKEKYDSLNTAVKEMSANYHSAANFIHKQMHGTLKKYEEWKQVRRKASMACHNDKL
jgi:metal-responsive CopG/Arc/MetJ family transcriptional regulator